MKKLIYVSLILFAFTACKNNTTEKESGEEILVTEHVPDMHTSKIALDWQGVYKGILPCADCEGIEIEVSLSGDNSYVVKRLYLGKENNYFEETGVFEWTEDGGSIVLTEKVKGSPTLFKVGENYLLHLNQKGEIIEGVLAEKYVLRKE
jgi:uncharacterized lipoprotein NlpE involved in copper resistance